MPIAVKSSLFLPILALVHHSNIATKQRAFNKAMITKSTEVIFIDEASTSTMDIDDWKILTQGGYTACDVKYQTARSFINRCPMLITAQQKLQFKAEDQPAMDRRLRNYTFKSLPAPKKRAADWLRKHPMECVAWAAKNARRAEEKEDSSENSDEEEVDQDMENDDGTLPEAEKEALRKMVFVDVLADHSEETGEEDVLGSEQGSGEDHVGANEAPNIANLRQIIEECSPMSLRHRQATRVLQKRLDDNVRMEEWQREEHRRRQQQLMTRGVTVEHAQLLPEDALDPLPTPIAKDLQRFNDVQAAVQKELRREKARKAYEGHWLRSTERELHDCVKSIFSCVDPEMRESLTAYREVLEDKLKNHHRNLGTLGSCEALQERKRVCVSLGVLKKSHEHLVKCVFAALPIPEELGESSGSATQHEEECAQEDPGGQTGDQNCSTGEAVDDDDENIFITPIPSWHTSHTAFEKARKATTDKASSQTWGKSPRSNSTQSKTAKRACKNSIARYFSSQQ